MSNDHSSPDATASTPSTAIVAAVERSTVDSVLSIDLRNFSQPELLAFTRSSHFAPRLSQTEFVTPKIDRSVFNESAGGRRQTYARLRLAAPGSSKPASAASSRGAVVRQRDREEEDNFKIIGAFKQLFNMGDCEGGNGDGVWVAVEVGYGGSVPESLHSSSVSVPVQVIGGSGSAVEVPINVPLGLGAVSVEGSGAGTKRKRGRPRKSESRGSENVGMELVIYQGGGNEEEFRNVDGRASDLEGLGGLEDPYGEELKIRTQGLESETDLLRFLTGFEGDWVDWKMESKFIDASKLGGVLPQGWKILVGMEHQNGQSLLSCQQYISPDGQRFLSWKESSAYLLSSNEHQTTQAGCGGTSQNEIDISSEVDTSCEQVMTGERKESEILRCHKCTLTFNEKRGLLQHIISFHKKDSKKCRSEYSKCEAAIMKDGRYECQICRKFFEPKKRFDGHFGNHIKDFLKMLAASIGAGNVQIDMVPISDSPKGSQSQELNIEQNTSSKRVNTIVPDISHLGPFNLVADEYAATGVSPEKHIHETFMLSKDNKTMKAGTKIRSTAKDDMNESSANSLRDVQESGNEDSRQTLNEQINSNGAKDSEGLGCLSGVVQACANDNKCAMHKVARLDDSGIAMINEEIISFGGDDTKTHWRTGLESLPLSETVLDKDADENVLESNELKSGIREETKCTSVLEQTSSHLNHSKSMSKDPEM